MATPETTQVQALAEVTAERDELHAAVAEYESTLRDGERLDRDVDEQHRRQVAKLTVERDRLRAEVRAARRLRGRLRDLVTDARECDAQLLALRDKTSDHKKALGIERGAHEVRAIADSLDRILGVDGSPDDSQVLVAKADLVAYLNRGTGDLMTEVDALNRLLAAAGLDQQDGDGHG